MRVLSNQEVNEVNGGILPIIAAIAGVSAIEVGVSAAAAVIAAEVAAIAIWYEMNY